MLLLLRDVHRLRGPQVLSGFPGRHLLCCHTAPQSSIYTQPGKKEEGYRDFLCFFLRSSMRTESAVRAGTPVSTARPPTDIRHFGMPFGSLRQEFFLPPHFLIFLSQGYNPV